MRAYNFCGRTASKLDTAGNHRLHNRGTARDIDDLDIKTMFFKQAGFFGEMIDFLARAHTAIP